jgi:type IX secretion system substrate protein
MKQIYRLYGIPYRIHCTPFLIALSLSLFLLLPATSHAQVNSYAKVTAITTSSGRSVLTISNRNQTYHTFAAGEQVIVMQMQDNVIGANTNNNAAFGTLSDIGNAGFYDVATIFSVTATTMTLTGLLSATFTIGANSSVQVVSFTSLAAGNFPTTANIPAVAWNESLGTGGVVAIQVGGTLTLRHSITADGQGFAGGAISNDYESGCEPGVYQTNDDNYAAKGKGIYLSTNTAYNRGRARLLNGGGGGSDDNAGGAGGGNYSAGGNGGAGWTCDATPAGGLGGIALNTYLMSGTRLFMGGGGGGGQGNNSTQTAGAAGGGIVIIKANAITTNCSSSTVRISANGNNSAGTSGDGNDGAGGAGAGGTIILQVNSFSVPSSCRLQIRANGGNGGDVNNSGAHGGGGGGGQGAILFSNAVPTTNVTTGTAPGIGGLNSDAAGGTRAGNGTGTANSGVIGGIGVVLPVRLLHFSAENTNKKAVLHWTAGNDANTLFTIQHATDGINFTTIGTVKGTGNSNTSTNYTFTDANAVPGRNYYQLLMTGDPTAQTSYSGVVSVNMTDMQSIPVAWPNPAHDHFSVRVNNAFSSKNHVVTITDLTGKLMYTNYYKPANGIITVTPGSQLKPGIYMFKLTSEGYEQSGKLIIR